MGERWREREIAIMVSKVLSSKVKSISLHRICLLNSNGKREGLGKMKRIESAFCAKL